MDRRRVEEQFFKTLMIISTSIIVGSLLAILVVVVLRGGPALSIEMLTQTPQGGYYLGKGGGILNAIVGSLYLAIGATVLSLSIALPVAFYLQEYAGESFKNYVRLSLDVLWGVPSIVYGAFGFMIMLYLGLRACLLGGIIALTLLMLPIMTRAIDEVMRLVPFELRESSYGLGFTKLEVVSKVLSRQTLPGIITAVLLAFGRGIGDAASLLFTAGYTDHIPRSLFDPVASLPLAVFFQLGTPYPEVQEKAYASAVILLVIILLISIGTRVITKKWSKFVIK
ncbi:MAG: phosphate ABC transporter permease PstA [Candidatus Methanospirareceae archaeon]